jgi:hypothetical protein
VARDADAVDGGDEAVDGRCRAHRHRAEGWPTGWWGPEARAPVRARWHPVAGRRIVAYLLDWTSEPISCVWTVLWLEPLRSPLRAVLAATWVAWVAVQLHLQARTGQTLGKRSVGIAVVDGNHLRPVGLRPTLTRWLLHGIDSLVVVGWLGGCTAADTVADRLSGTVVIRWPTRIGGGAEAPSGALSGSLSARWPRGRRRSRPGSGPSGQTAPTRLRPVRSDGTRSATQIRCALKSKTPAMASLKRPRPSCLRNFTAHRAMRPLVSLELVWG